MIPQNTLYLKIFAEDILLDIDKIRSWEKTGTAFNMLLDKN